MQASVAPPALPPARRLSVQSVAAASWLPWITPGSWHWWQRWLIVTSSCTHARWHWHKATVQALSAVGGRPHGGRGIWLDADKSGQGGREGRFLPYFCGRPLWMTPYRPMYVTGTSLLRRQRWQLSRLSTSRLLLEDCAKTMRHQIRSRVIALRMFGARGQHAVCSGSYPGGSTVQLGWLF